MKINDIKLWPEYCFQPEQGSRQLLMWRIFMSFNLKSKIVALVMSTVALASHAGLMGESVTLNFYYPNVASLYCTNGVATVTAGVEFPTGCSGFGPVGVDVGDTSLAVTVSGGSFAPGTFNGIELDAASDITSVTFVGGSLTPFNYYLQDGDLWINFQNASGEVANFSFTTERQSVPEPSTLLLMGLGLFAALRVRRR